MGIVFCVCCPRGIRRRREQRDGYVCRRQRSTGVTGSAHGTRISANGYKYAGGIGECRYTETGIDETEMER